MNDSASAKIRGEGINDDKYCYCQPIRLHLLHRSHVRAVIYLDVLHHQELSTAGRSGCETQMGNQTVDPIEPEISAAQRTKSLDNQLKSWYCRTQ